jgi:LPS-assembly lipoprotein
MISSPRFILCLVLALLTLSACGFTPVYGSGASFANSGPVTVQEIEGRTGHFLRQELLRTVGQGVPGVKGSSDLEVKVTQTIERLAFTPDQAASRSDYVGSANWSLRGVDGKLLMTGSVRERASFNFADSPYADIAAQTAAQERLATQLARSIRAQMLIGAGKPPGVAAAPAPAAPILPPLPGSSPATLPSPSKGQ